MDYESLVSDILFLFSINDYEEILFPIIHNYVKYQTGSLTSPNEYEIGCVKSAFSLLGKIYNEDFIPV